MLLLDTHVWAWAVIGDRLLSALARRVMDETPSLLLSPVSFYEISHKARLGKWPQMAVHVHELADLAQQQGIIIVPVSAEIALAAGQLDWSHRDPFDRVLAATALTFDMTLISADTAFDDVDGLRRVWD